MVSDQRPQHEHVDRPVDRIHIDQRLRSDLPDRFAGDQRAAVGLPGDLFGDPQHGAAVEHGAEPFGAEVPDQLLERREVA